ncbi:MAG: hypothetical protein M1833_005171 [Piccolia ochrophora]|nr:MAG: hypothetical protein M1833_005171 [Piccolia ochrophora]
MDDQVLSPKTYTRPAKAEEDLTNISHLIRVCCHAIWTGGPSNGADEHEWLIEPFQQGETPTFTAHIKMGLKALSEEPRSLLVFSGAATKRDAQLSEAQSYLNLARANAYFNLPLPSPCTHITTDPHALDSYQNLLFPILRHRRLTHRYPWHITLVSHAFKRRRFLDLHCAAIRWLVARVTFLGLDPPEEVTSRESLMKGEERRGWGVWRWDLYGVGEVLRGKRVGRDCWGTGGVEGLLNDMGGDMELEEMRGLLEWEGGGSGVEVYQGRLPWVEDM